MTLNVPTITIEDLAQFHERHLGRFDGDYNTLMSSDEQGEDLENDQNNQGDDETEDKQLKEEIIEYFEWSEAHKRKFEEEEKEQINKSTKTSDENNDNENDNEISKKRITVSEKENPPWESIPAEVEGDTFGRYCEYISMLNKQTDVWFEFAAKQTSKKHIEYYPAAPIRI